MSHQINLNSVATLMTRTRMQVGWLHLVSTLGFYTWFGYTSFVPCFRALFQQTSFWRGSFSKMSPLFCNKTRFCWAFLPKSSILHRAILQMSPDHGACAHRPGCHHASELTPSRRVILFERVMVHSRVGDGGAVHMHEPTKARRHILASVTWHACRVVSHVVVMPDTRMHRDACIHMSCHTHGRCYQQPLKLGAQQRGSLAPTLLRAIQLRPFGVCPGEERLDFLNIKKDDVERRRI